MNHIGSVWPSERKGFGGSPAYCNRNICGGESLADDLNGNGVL